MKFAKELERDCVPEWRLKYLDYKLGKKKLKAVSRALKTVNQTPRIRHRGNTLTPSPFATAPTYSFFNRSRSRVGQDARGDWDTNGIKSAGTRSSSANLKANGKNSSRSRNTSRDPEQQPLREGGDPGFPRMTRYGSIMGSPTEPGNSMGGRRAKDHKPLALELPDPALDPDHASLSQFYGQASPTARQAKNPSFRLPPNAFSAFEVGKTKSPKGQASTFPHRYKSIFKRVNSMPGTEGARRPRVMRMFSFAGNGTPESAGISDMPLESYWELEFRQVEFFSFLDSQLENVETFYKEKEDEATSRLNVLREQLHFMRDRRLEEVVAQQTAKYNSKQKRLSDGILSNAQGSSTDEEQKSRIMSASWMKPLDTALGVAKAGRVGKGTKAMKELGTPHTLQPKQAVDERRDYSRRPASADVPYRSAKRKLKTALQEYYRGLELLKSYALLNRTAFRKITKKYDKTVNARPSGRYMTEKVNTAWFVKSDVVDGHIHAVEDLYARYFEQGNHKVAIGKLRIKTARAGDYTENTFRNGLMVAAGLIFGIEGLVYGLELLNSPDRTLALDTSYLLQLYAGYFLMVFLMLLFCMVCRIWQNSKINFAFVFEFDTRHHLDWRQLSELPCAFLCLLGVFIWLNFSRFGSESLYIYYPVILIGITAIVLLFPAPILYHRTRKWFLYSIWRLALAGLYPVEFRDFYLGDMFCSLTYSMGNIELFFCLYANEWKNPGQCNSTHSRLLGFFTALPSVWRAVQCIRRYKDTRNVFPHLVNCGKYMATILFYVTLSVYRIGKSPHHQALFIVFATINSIYCSIWDVIMDWSLGDPYAKNMFLRETLGYKKVWLYYVAMVVDPILRFNWICYAIWPIELQHSAILSFAVAFSEVFRRGMWSIFRVENEHCTNVGRFRASRDIPLPYEFPLTSDLPTQPTPHTSLAGQQDSQFPSEAALSPIAAASTASHASGTDLEAARTHSTTHRQRRGTTSPSGRPSPAPLGGLSRVGTMLHAAHAQDFERKKMPEAGAKEESEDEDDPDDGDDVEADDESSDDEQEESEMKTAKAVGDGGLEIDEAAGAMRHAERLERYSDHGSSGAVLHER